MTALIDLQDTSTASMRIPASLRAGDKIRFVSPASPPDRGEVLRRAALLESWGLVVEFGRHAFNRVGYLAGSDEQRLADLNDALRDPAIRAVFATRGGKGSYRIADQLDFAAARQDPKFLVGFSDITMLHLALLRQTCLVGIHGALLVDPDGDLNPIGAAALRAVLMTSDDIVIAAQRDASTAALTTSGTVTGPLIGGNLDMIATAAGWAMPRLSGCILLLEAVNMGLGQVDRQLTMLRQAGHLDGIAGIAVGQFTGFKNHGSFSIIDLLQDHLWRHGVPVLGGLPLGHEPGALSLPIGMVTTLDTAAATLAIARADQSAGGD